MAEVRSEEWRAHMRIPSQTQNIHNNNTTNAGLSHEEMHNIQYIETKTSYTVSHSTSMLFATL